MSFQNIRLSCTTSETIEYQVEYCNYNYCIRTTTLQISLEFIPLKIIYPTVDVGNNIDPNIHKTLDLHSTLCMQINNSTVLPTYL